MSSPPRRRVVAAPARRPRVELRAVRVLVEPDPEESDLVSVRAEAEVAIEGTLQILESGGLIGVERDEVTEIAAEEWTRLRTVLKTVGVATEQLPLDVHREWIEWRT